MTDAIETRSSRSATADNGLREKIEAQLEAGQRDSAIQAARLLLSEQPGLRSLRFVRKAAESDAALRAGLKPYKVALLSSFSIEFAHDALIAYGFINGLRLDLYQAGFGAFRQELLNRASALYAWSPDAMVLAVEGEDWVPAAYGGNSQGADHDAARLVEDFRSEIDILVSSLRAHSSVPLLIHNFALPAWRRLGVLDAGSADGQAHLVNRLNDALREAAAASPGVYIVDYAALTNRHGTLHWYDPRMRLYARAPIAQPMLAELAREHLKFFRCLVGASKKCLVLDLDNTLWGGVVGEEGVDGIQLGPTYPGSAFVEFQQHVLALQQRGVILAIASKNNPADVDEVFARQRFMALRKEHFADLQIHWELKSESLSRIAANLGIGLEHIVFVDDNPAECEQVRGTLPMVTVLRLPPQPERYTEALHADGWFDVLALSNEDLRRGELYQQRAGAGDAALIERQRGRLLPWARHGFARRPRGPRFAEAGGSAHAEDQSTQCHDTALLGGSADGAHGRPGLVPGDRGRDRSIRRQRHCRRDAGTDLGRSAGDRHLPAELPRNRTRGRDGDARAPVRPGRAARPACRDRAVDTDAEEPAGPGPVRAARLCQGLGGRLGRDGMADRPATAARAVAGLVPRRARWKLTMQQDLETAIKRVMADVLDLDANAVQDDTSADNTPRWDSANHIQLVLALEEEFSISFDVTEIESMLSFFDVVQVVQSKL